MVALVLWYLASKRFDRSPSALFIFTKCKNGFLVVSGCLAVDTHLSWLLMSWGTNPQDSMEMLLESGIQSGQKGEEPPHWVVASTKAIECLWGGVCPTGIMTKEAGLLFFTYLPFSSWNSPQKDEGRNVVAATAFVAKISLVIVDCILFSFI